MSDRTTLAPELSAAAEEPLYRQLYRRLRLAIVEGRLQPGSRLPSTRALSVEWGVGRNTAIAAVEQLIAEGYLTARIGSGTYVSEALPDPTPTRPAERPRDPAAVAGPEALLSERARSLLALINRRGGDRDGSAFLPGVPEVAAFPWPLWLRILARHQRAAPPDAWSYGHEAIHPALKTVLAEYLAVSRGVICHPDQIVAVGAMQQGFDLLARALADPGEAVWMEEPGYGGAYAAFASAGLAVAPVPVDGQGMAWQGRELPEPRLIYVTPSHQYPLGSVMSMARRQALLAEAARRGAWIVEDDYDGEFRHDGRPLAALQGLDRHGRTLYLGTFSKVMFPGLGIAYMVVPPRLAAPLSALQGRLYRKPCLVTQAALAEFIADGHFGAHLRRMRGVYARRRDKLQQVLQRRLGERVRLYGAEAGIHLVLRLPEGCGDVECSEALARHGIAAPALSSYAMAAAPFPGLLLGYGAVGDAELLLAAHRLADVLAPMLGEGRNSFY